MSVKLVTSHDTKPQNITRTAASHEIIGGQIVNLEGVRATVRACKLLAVHRRLGKRHAATISNVHGRSMSRHTARGTRY
jgi:hypothetical protein